MRLFLPLFGSALLSISTGLSAAEPDSQIMPQAEAFNEKGEGWIFRRYFNQDTPSTRLVITGSATIMPGAEIHPPHEHAEEEYLMVTKGTGTWTLNGKDMAADTGDLLYAAPWEPHGIRNTGDTPLEFVVFKYHGKGVPLPEKPAGSM